MKGLLAVRCGDMLCHMLVSDLFPVVHFYSWNMTLHVPACPSLNSIKTEVIGSDAAFCEIYSRLSLKD